MWLQLICQSTKAFESEISEGAENLGAVSITLSDAADVPVLEPLPNETPLWDEIIFTLLFREDQQTELETLKKLLTDNKENWQISHIRQENLKDQQWERVWMDDFHPMKFGQNLWIYPSWSEAPNDDSVVIKLDPGLAFGTGTHPTTALCLEWLDSNPPVNQSVIDYGCGSGVLAIAAIKLGAKEVTATDIDQQALTATLNNQLNNGIPAEKIRSCFPDDMPTLKVDLMLANILCGPLVSLAPKLCASTKPGGQIVLSGVLKEQQAMLEEVYQNYCHDIQFATSGDWVRMTGIVNKTQ